MLGKFWTFANMLSLARLILVIPITYLILVDGSLTLIFALVTLGVLTDWFDGRVARWSHTVSDWGKVLDPLADKVAAAMIVMALALRPGPYALPLWLLGLLVVRDSLIVAGGVLLARRTGHVVMSAWLGKAAVTAIAITVLAALLKADAPVLQFCVWTTAGLLVVSFLQYAVRYVRLMRRGGPPVRANPTGRATSLDAVEESVEVRP